jgi:hypothetical protein
MNVIIVVYNDVEHMHNDHWHDQRDTTTTSNTGTHKYHSTTKTVATTTPDGNQLFTHTTTHNNDRFRRFKHTHRGRYIHPRADPDADANFHFELPTFTDTDPNDHRTHTDNDRTYDDHTHTHRNKTTHYWHHHHHHRTGTTQYRDTHTLHTESHTHGNTTYTNTVHRYTVHHYPSAPTPTAPPAPVFFEPSWSPKPFEHTSPRFGIERRLFTKSWARMFEGFGAPTRLKRQLSTWRQASSTSSACARGSTNRRRFLEPILSPKPSISIWPHYSVLSDGFLSSSGAKLIWKV